MGTPEPITRVVTTTAGQARICIWGDPSAEPVLLLHGTGGSAMLWDDVATRLLTDRCVVAVDLRGHGESSRPTPPSYRFADYARDVRDVARSLGSAPAVLAGHSMGALVAILLAAEGDLPIRGLAILDIEAAPPVHQVEHLRAAGARPARRFGTIEEAIAAEQRALPQVPVERLRRIIDHRYRVLPDGCLEERADREAMRGFEQIDLRPLLGRITCPALVLRGQTSIVMRRDVAEAMARTLPNGVFREVSGVGHQLILERPDAVAAQLNEWLRDALG